MLKDLIEQLTCSIIFIVFPDCSRSLHSDAARDFVINILSKNLKNRAAITSKFPSHAYLKEMTTVCFSTSVPLGDQGSLLASVNDLFREITFPTRGQNTGTRQSVKIARKENKEKSCSLSLLDFVGFRKEEIYCRRSPISTGRKGG